MNADDAWREWVPARPLQDFRSRETAFKDGFEVGGREGYAEALRDARRRIEAEGNDPDLNNGQVVGLALAIEAVRALESEEK